MRISRSGLPSYYLCKLGLDENSDFAEKELKKEQVNINFCVHTPQKKACCVYVHLNEVGDRYFHAYINETPDEWLTSSELHEDPFQAGKIFYFGSGTLFHSTAKSTTEQALNYARKYKNIVAFDTNIRLKRWDSEENCRDTILTYIRKADIVKMAEDELLFLTEAKTINEGLMQLKKWDIPFLFITRGSDGAEVLHGGKTITVPGLKVNSIDTTGAGDAFLSTILYCFHEKGIPQNDHQLKEYLEIANEVGAKSTTKLGSL
ncbi:PfkB family carbohydrate kinase [Bacillus sp. T3]|uniref:PfkB family carbohydrate kinase n=1 Tax=Bacillus sp. T3 TaxID=467262 RepID=UPI002981BDC0|nr:PfkB family carbohydrate kinase [Bacillus sp. T3]